MSVCLSTVRTDAVRLSSTLSWAAYRCPCVEVRKGSRTWRFERSRAGPRYFICREDVGDTSRRMMSRLLEVRALMARKLRPASRSLTILSHSWSVSLGFLLPFPSISVANIVSPNGICRLCQPNDTIILIHYTYFCMVFVRLCMSQWQN